MNPADGVYDEQGVRRQNDIGIPSHQFADEKKLFIVF